MFKTLVARGDRTGVLLAVVPGNAELDPRALAQVAGDRRVEVVSLEEVQPLTGYVRGTQILLAPGDYLRAVGGRLGAIACDKCG